MNEQMRKKNVIPILFTIENANKKNSNRSQTHKHLYTNKQTTDKDMLLENIKIQINKTKRKIRTNSHTQT